MKSRNGCLQDGARAVWKRRNAPCSLTNLVRDLADVLSSGVRRMLFALSAHQRCSSTLARCPMVGLWREESDFQIHA